MENTEQSLEKTDDNYKVPNLEKGIAVIEYLSSRSEGETLQAIKVALDISQTTAYRIHWYVWIIFLSMKIRSGIN